MQKVFIQIYLLFLIALIGAVADLGIPKFRNAPFKVRPSSGMYKLGDLNLDFDDVKNGNQISAYGDFNNDKATDFVSLSDDDYTLNVFVYSNNGSFVQYYKRSFKEKISGIIPADYNYDGHLDLMVITPYGSKKQTLTILFGTTLPSRFYTYNEEDPFVLDSPVMPFVFDADGNRQVDLLFAKGSTRYVILDFDTFTDVFYFEDLYVLKSPKCLDYSLVRNNEFMSPNSNAFVDFNGDCAADLFLTTKDPDGNTVFEIWLRDLPSGKFCLVDATKITLPDISLVSIADMDSDGRLDLVYTDNPANISLPMNLHIIYNQFPTDTATPCKISSYEVEGVSGGPFVKEAYNMPIEKWTETNLTITQITAVNSTFLNNSRLFSSDPTRPPRIRLGDIDVDGYVDVIMVVNEANKTDPEYGSVLLGINNKRGGGLIFNFTNTTDSSLTPYFQVHADTAEKTNHLISLSNFKALGVSFFDFDEKGSLGLWISTYNEQTQKSSLIGVYNFVSSSNYILKTLALNGNTNGNDDDINKKLGGIYHGASIECIVNDVYGKARIAKASQFGQTGYTALELPYAFIGLGRTNNYVQDFTMGIAQNLKSKPKDLQQQTWTPIIPNSQLIVNPLVNEDWTLDVFVSPMSQTWLVVLITVVILILLAIVIFVLHLKERNEDKKKEERFWVFA